MSLLACLPSICIDGSSRPILHRQLWSPLCTAATAGGGRGADSWLMKPLQSPRVQEIYGIVIGRPNRVVVRLVGAPLRPLGAGCSTGNWTYTGERKSLLCHYLRIENAEGYVLIGVYLFIYLLPSH